MSLRGMIFMAKTEGWGKSAMTSESETEREHIVEAAATVVGGKC